MTERLVHAVLTKDGYDAVMHIVEEILFNEEYRPTEEDRVSVGGFFDGYGIHPYDCCGAFDRLLEKDGYKKEGGAI